MTLQFLHSSIWVKKRSVPKDESVTEMEWKEYKAEDAELENISTFVSTYLEERDASMSFMFKVQLAIEEVFVNISHYAYENEPDEDKKKVRFGIREQDNVFTFVFEDEGVEFNPLLREEVDVTAQEDSDKVGGLGIFIVKKNMDTVDYQRDNNKNVLTLTVKK